MEILYKALLIACEEIVKYKTLFYVTTGRDTIDDLSADEYASVFLKMAKDKVYYNEDKRERLEVNQ